MCYDVIVVGAGPAGAVLAYRLVNHGLKVLLLEKERLSRYKACGGGLTLKTIKDIPFDVSPILERQAVGGILTYAGRKLGKIKLARPVAWLVMRDRFDNFLVECAVAAGVDLIDGTMVREFEQDDTNVQVWTSRGLFRSLVLAGADGVNSRVAKVAGLLTDRKTGVAIEAELGVPTVDLEAQGAYATFDFGALPGGYAWIFPKSDHFSVGVFQANSRKTRCLKQDLEHFIANQRVLRDHRKLKQVGHRIPLGNNPGQLHAGRVLLLGDAANLADPWLGEGIYYAIDSANEAAPVILDFLENKVEDLSEYSARINRKLKSQFLEAKRYATLMYRFPAFCSCLFWHSPYMIESVFSLLRGDLDFKRLTRTLWRGTPRIFYEALRG